LFIVHILRAYSEIFATEPFYVGFIAFPKNFMIRWNYITWFFWIFYMLSICKHF